MNSLNILPSEQSDLIMVCQSTSIINFYIGDCPRLYLLHKVKSIIELNPWLSGKLVKDQENCVSIEYPINTAVINCFFDISVAVDEEANYEDITSSVSQFLVKSGKDCLNQNEPLFKVFYASSKRGFCVCVSLSHILGDGHTFYKVYSMLDKDTAPFSLYEERNQGFIDKLHNMLGIEELGILTSKALTIGTYQTLLFQKKPTVISRYVNANGVMTLKDQSQIQSDANDTKNITKDAFISTNDILTSWFFKACKSDFGFMALNFRHRTSGLGDLHAGNYESLVLYNSEDFDTPNLIRESISNSCESGMYKRAVTRHIPSFWTTCKCRCAVATNWASLYHHITLPNDSVHLLHLPIYSLDSMALRDTMVIFKPTKDTLGCLIFTRSLEEHVDIIRDSDLQEVDEIAMKLFSDKIKVSIL